MLYNKKGQKAGQYSSKAFQEFISSEARHFMDPSEFERKIRAAIAEDTMNWQEEFESLRKLYDDRQKSNIKNLRGDYIGIPGFLKETAELQEQLLIMMKKLRHDMKGAILKRLEIKSTWGEIFLEAVLIKSNFSIFSEFKISPEACRYIYQNSDVLTTAARDDFAKAFSKGNNERKGAMMKIAAQIAERLPCESHGFEGPRTFFVLEDETKEILRARREEWEPHIELISEMDRAVILRFVDSGIQYSDMNSHDRNKLLRAIKTFGWRLKKNSN